MDCEFADCNLSNLKLWNSSLKSVYFKNCKLLGIDFSKCEDFLFSVTFMDSNLDFTSFNEKKMPKTKFENCSLKETSFVRTNLTNVIFENCNLNNTIFNETVLIGADFTNAFNYKLDPEYNTIKKAKFSNAGIVGLLDKYNIIIK